MSIKILVGCDLLMVAAGIAHMIREMEGVELVATVADGKDMLEKLKEHSCQVLLLDFHLPGAQETAQLVRERYPEVKVVLLLKDELTRLKQIVQTGAAGYLQQEDGKEELEEAIRMVAADKPYLNQTQALELSVEANIRRNGHTAEDKAVLGKAAPDREYLKLLSKRETQILRMVGRELSSAEIAQQLFISVQTVETHRRNIMKKLGVRSLIGLLKYALREGLLE